MERFRFALKLSHPVMQQYLYSLSPIAHIIFFTGVFSGGYYFMATFKIQPCHLGNARNTMGLTRTPCMWTVHSQSGIPCASPHQKKEGEVPPKTEFFKPGRRRIDSKILKLIRLSTRRKISPNTHQAIKFQRPLGWVFQHFNLSTHTEAPHPPTPLRVYAQLRQPTKVRKLRLGAPGANPFPFTPFPFLLMVEMAWNLPLFTAEITKLRKILHFRWFCLGFLKHQQSQPKTVPASIAKWADLSYPASNGWLGIRPLWMFRWLQEQ